MISSWGEWSIKMINYFLTNSLSPLPREIFPLLREQIKKIYKKNNEEEEKDFLLQLEAFRNKWIYYGKVPAEKIFIFDGDDN